MCLRWYVRAPRWCLCALRMVSLVAYIQHTAHSMDNANDKNCCSAASTAGTSMLCLLLLWCVWANGKTGGWDTVRCGRVFIIIVILGERWWRGGMMLKNRFFFVGASKEKVVDKVNIHAHKQTGIYFGLTQFTHSVPYTRSGVYFMLIEKSMRVWHRGIRFWLSSSMYCTCIRSEAFSFSIAGE